MVCSAPAAERVRELAGSTTQVIPDDRALDKRVIELLAAILVRQTGDGTPAPSPPTSRHLGPRPSRRTARARGATREIPKGGGDGRGGRRRRASPAPPPNEEVQWISECL